MNEETLTYLNQGQPYEIKLKKLGELTAYRGVVFRSVVRLCFHDRRLQFSEREQIGQWEDSHPNDRILQVPNSSTLPTLHPPPTSHSPLSPQVDLPLSYGVTMIPQQPDVPTNMVSFLWEPLKEVGLYVKVSRQSIQPARISAPLQLVSLLLRSTASARSSRRRSTVGRRGFRSE
jgi:transcription factor CP2-like protein